MKVFKLKGDGKYLKNKFGDIMMPTVEGAEAMKDMLRCDISYNATEIVEIEIEAIKLLERFNNLTFNLNPDWPIEARSGKMMELIDIQKQAEKLLKGE
jgi:hypothetical protein